MTGEHLNRQPRVLASRNLIRARWTLRRCERLWRSHSASVNGTAPSNWAIVCRLKAHNLPASPPSSN